MKCKRFGQLLNGKVFENSGKDYKKGDVMRPQDMISNRRPFIHYNFRR